MAAELEEAKILFRLQQVDDYPPNEWETLWATVREDGLYTIDNIPFFVREISPGDVVSAEKKGEELHFCEIIHESMNSVIRVIVYDESDVSTTRQKLIELGCETELSHIPNLIAVEIPVSISLDDIIAFLDHGEQLGSWEYETASLRT